MININPRYSQFELGSLAEALTEIYDLPAPIKCWFFRNGLNDTYKITDAAGKSYYLRISLAEVHTLADIEEEIAVILRCRQENLAVVEPIARRDGKYVWEVAAPEGVRQAVLFREIISRPSNNTEARYKNLGVLIAKIHTATKSMAQNIHRPAIDKTMLSDRPLELLLPYLTNRMDDYEFMKRTNHVLWDFIEENLGNDDSFYGVCHGDIQPGNYYFIDEEPVIFDFDCLGCGYYAYDIGVHMGDLSFSDNDIYQKPIWNAFIEGYNSVRALNSKEIKAAFAFAALHMMRILAYHVEITEQNNGIFYYTSENHLNLFIGAYRRLYDVARKECGIAE